MLRVVASGCDVSESVVRRELWLAKNEAGLAWLDKVLLLARVPEATEVVRRIRVAHARLEDKARRSRQLTRFIPDSAIVPEVRDCYLPEAIPSQTSRPW